MCNFLFLPGFLDRIYRSEGSSDCVREKNRGVRICRIPDLPALNQNVPHRYRMGVRILARRALYSQKVTKIQCPAMARMMYSAKEDPDGGTGRRWCDIHGHSGAGYHQQPMAHKKDLIGDVVTRV